MTQTQSSLLEKCAENPAVRAALETYCAANASAEGQAREDFAEALKAAGISFDVRHSILAEAADHRSRVELETYAQTYPNVGRALAAYRALLSESPSESLTDLQRMQPYLQLGERLGWDAHVPNSQTSRMLAAEARAYGVQAPALTL